jgi:DNA-binding IclR family transcriptional regulator
MVERKELPSEVRDFVIARVHTIESLETLVVLYGARPQPLSIAELEARVQLGAESIRTATEELARSGLVQQNHGGIHYHPRDAQLDRLASALAAAYKSHRVELLVLISNQALHRVRKGALDTFSEAFRLRGPKKDG